METPLTPEREDEIGRALKEAVRKARGYADFFGWGPDRDLEELGVLTSLAESMHQDETLFFTNLRTRGRGNDPPDLEALDSLKRRIAFEVTELVDGEAIREYKRGRRYDFAEWNKERFLTELDSLLTTKNGKFPKLLDAPYEGGYIVVVFTDEPGLQERVVSEYLAQYTLPDVPYISRAFLVISYDPSTKRCPYFELARGA